MANEKRLIDANALLEKIQFRRPVIDTETKIVSDCVQIARKAIVDAPTVDAVEVVRCKDCKYCSHSGLCNLYLNVSHEMKPDDFCSRGERRADDEETSPFACKIRSYKAKVL